MYVISTFKKVLSILDKKQKRNLFLLVVLMLFAGILESIGISLIVPLVYVLIDENSFNNNIVIKSICNMLNIETQVSFIAIMFIALGITYIFKNFYLFAQTKLQNNYVYNNRARFFKSLFSLYLNKDYSYFIDNAAGNIVRSIYNDVIYTFTILLCFINIITECVISFVILVCLLFINFKVSLFVGFVLLFELIVINKVIKPLLTNSGKINIINSNNFFNNIIQSIESIKEIKVFNKEKFFITKNENYASRLSETDKLNANLSVIPKLLIEAFTFSTIFFLLAGAAIIGIDIELLIPSLSAFAVAAVKLLPSINKISSNLSNISYYVPNLDNIVNVIKDNNCVKENTVVKDSLNNTMDFNSRIEFKNIDFKYNGTNKYIFKNLNLLIPVNCSMGIVGGSGEGKTTLVDLLTGLLEPTSGMILCDGKNINDNYCSWLNIIGYIPQNTTLINDSIRANVAFGVDENLIDDNQVWTALADAQINDFVSNMEQGLDTNIGDRGIKLSGGQRQRIGIARALYKNPKILIFDEATSALDNDTEKEVMKSINSLMDKRTIIIIAHRLSTIQNCKVLYKVENGNIKVL